ncbi:MAG: acyl-CoA thioester hydrolase/BAAT C-terminal domain-containing protein [Actinomycetota bacterium]
MREPDGVDASNVEWCRPSNPAGVGALVLAGSSGHLPVDRARVLADHGVSAVAFRWFGGPGLPSTPIGVELESFVHVIDALATTVDRVGIVGSSFGAEAALSVAVRVSSVRSVVAFAPTTHVWPGRSDTGEAVSHWTWEGRPVPFAPMDPEWMPDADPPAYRSWYEVSAAAAPDDARIRCEEIVGDVVLVAGGDDQVWPSHPWALDIERRRAAHRRPTSVVSLPDAGHRPVLPGERPPVGGVRMRRGGHRAADAALGRIALPEVLSALGIGA